MPGSTLLRGFRGMGLGVVLLAIFLAAIPMTQTRHRIPWAEGRRTATQSLLTIVLVAALPLGALVMQSNASDHRMAVVEILVTRQLQ